jgi:hypothetical protein
MLPAVYMPHGGGPMPLLGDSAHAGLTKFLRTWPSKVPKPKSIVVVSAHWEVRKARDIELHSCAPHHVLRGLLFKQFQKHPHHVLGVTAVNSTASRNRGHCPHSIIFSILLIFLYMIITAPSWQLS